MSSQQRSASMDVTVRQVADLTRANNALNARLDAMKLQYSVDPDYFTTEADRVITRRLDALERVTAQRWSLPLLSRLRWLFTGR